jgi:membrane-bound metal-dependent hydrolase YbcI (DUF457 family)
MPQAVTHILLPILAMAIFRDFYLRNKDRKSFPLHYVLIAGIGGVLPDIDIIFFWLLGKFDASVFTTFHKGITHTIWFALLFFLIFLILKPINLKAKICNLGKHKLKLSIISLMLSIGILFHIGLDALFWEGVHVLYPLSDFRLNYNIIAFLSDPLQDIFLATLDGVLLVIWLVYLEWKHKISDFI